MNPNVEKRITKLENEAAALKASFEKNAGSLILFTKSVEFTTLENKCVGEQEGYEPITFDGNERIIVTFDTENGANTPAILELDTDNINEFGTLIVRRIPYNGGAAWQVINSPKYDDITYSEWQPTHYTFTVHSLINGTLGAKMIWQ